jgi:hypothetical protein
MPRGEWCEHATGVGDGGELVADGTVALQREPAGQRGRVTAVATPDEPRLLQFPERTGHRGTGHLERVDHVTVRGWAVAQQPERRLTAAHQRRQVVTVASVHPVLPHMTSE